MKLTRRKFIKLLGTTSLTALTATPAFSQNDEANLDEIRVAYPPTMAALPLAKGSQPNFFLEEQEVKPFEKQNIKIKLIPSKGSSDAARLVSGGRADCSITGLTSSLYAIHGTGNLKITSTAFDPNKTGRHFGLVTSSLYEIPSVTDLIENWLDSSSRKSIVLSLRRDDHYATDQLIKASGFSSNDSLYYIDQEDLISRMTGLLNGNYISAVLPEPLLTLSLENPQFEGYQANLITDYKNVDIPPFVFVFREKLLKDNPELVRRFYQGWMDSLEETNNSNNFQLLGLTTKIISQTLPSLRGVIENTEFTEDFANLFEVPTFTPPEELDRKIYNSTLEWAIEKKYLTKKIPYEEVFEGSSAIFADAAR